MKTKECPSCAMEVDSDSTECMYCHYEFPTQNKGYVWIAVLLIIFFLWLIIF